MGPCSSISITGFALYFWKCFICERLTNNMYVSDCFIVICPAERLVGGVIWDIQAPCAHCNSRLHRRSSKCWWGKYFLYPQYLSIQYISNLVFQPHSQTVICLAMWPCMVMAKKLSSFRTLIVTFTLYFKLISALYFRPCQVPGHLETVWWVCCCWGQSRPAPSGPLQVREKIMESTPGLHVL